MNKSKRIFFKLLRPASAFIGKRKLKSMLTNQLVFPLYHNVSNKPPVHIKYLYPSRSIEVFTKDLDDLLKVCQPISLNEIIENVYNDRDYKTPTFHVTFDDGLRDFHEVAAPILLKKGVPATCFLNSAFIDNKELFYRFKSSILIEQLHTAKENSFKWKRYHEWIRNNRLKNTYYRKVLLSIRYNKRHLLDELAENIEVDFSDYLSTKKPYLTSEQVKSLINKGFTFGAHSIDHPDYKLLSEDDQLHQTITSLESICRKFNLNYKVFSFPFTDTFVKKSFFNRLYESNSVDLTFGCTGIKKDVVNYNYQRITVGSYNEPVFVLLTRKLLYFNFLKLIGKETISRV